MPITSTSAAAKPFRTLPQQIAANRNASLGFAFLIAALLAGLGTVVVGIWDPTNWMLGTVGSLLLGVVISMIAFKSGPGIVLALSGAREATDREFQVLNNVVEEMAIAAGVPTPKVMVIDDPSPNALATGMDPKTSTIAVTTGLLDRLNRDELQGVVAHEMGHIRNYDIRFMTVVGLLAGLIPLLSQVFLRSTWFAGGRRRDDRDGGGDLGAVFMVVGILLAILAPIGSILLQLAVSRQREYLADATAAQLTRNPEGLASALRKISREEYATESRADVTNHMFIVNPFKRMGGTDLFSTHPPLAERIAALEAIQGHVNEGPSLVE